MAKHRLRTRGVDAVLAEIDFLVNTFGVRNIKIMDELFAVNEKRVLALCEGIAARGYDLNFWAYARVNTVTERMLAAMKRAGVNWIAYGFESGSKRVIEAVSKGYKPEQVARVVEMTCAQDQHICANFIFGLPEDDYDSMQETLALMQEINAEWANIYSAMAYPGSKLYDEAVAQGLPLPASWNGFSQYSRDCLPLPTRHLTGGQVLAFRDYAFDAYYRNPRYLSMIRAKFGEETMRHIQAMSAKHLERDHLAV
ncbi:radical SAM protein [Desulfovibrio aminophilus]|nr:radical SAM protein [Desulfovibrio aminophilus]MCM0755916.1 radical SAM protein [Desulfovibrio aminophilus]